MTHSTMTDQDTAEALTMLGDSLTRYLADHHPFDARTASQGASRPTWWAGLGGQLDLLGAAWPEAAGGLNAGMAAHAQVLRVLGASLAGDPYLSTVVLCAGALMHSGSPLARAQLAQVRAGTSVLAWAHSEPDARHDRLSVQTRLTAAEGEAAGGMHWLLNGRKSVVHAAPWADHFVVSACVGASPADGLVLLLVPAQAAGLTQRSYPTMDGGQAAEVQFDQVRLNADAVLVDATRGASVIEALMDDATLALCAESLGVMARLLKDSLDYARQRRQFGVPIASFQSLQHRLADMQMSLSLAEALTVQTAQHWDGMTPVERSMAASSCKVMTARACKAVSQGAVQIHGGMGMTEELAVGHFARRATLIEHQWGSPLWHLRRRVKLSAQSG